MSLGSHEYDHPLSDMVYAILKAVWLKASDGSDTGDVITGINDRKVTKAADLAIALDSFQVGDRVTLKVRRGDEGAQVGCCACCLRCDKLPRPLV